MNSNASEAKIATLENKAHEAYLTYCTTPRGQNDLFREIAELRHRVTAEPDLQTQLEEKEELLQRSVIIRQKQLDEYKTFKLNKTNTAKSQFQGATKNKQQLAVHILQSTLVTSYPDMTCEPVDGKVIALTSASQPHLNTNVLVIPQKQQAFLTPLPEDSMPARLQKGLDKEVNVTLQSIPRDNRFAITHWMLEFYKQQGVSSFASVDTKLETVYINNIDALPAMYDIQFKLKKRYGGTYLYPHGNTDALQEDLQVAVLEGVVSVEKGSDNLNRTYLRKPSKLLTAKEQHLQRFFLSYCYDEQEEETYYEVKKKHETTNDDLYVSFVRKNALIPHTDISRLTEKR